VRTWAMADGISFTTFRTYYFLNICGIMGWDGLRCSITLATHSHITPLLPPTLYMNSSSPGRETEEGGGEFSFLEMSW